MSAGLWGIYAFVGVCLLFFGTTTLSDGYTGSRTKGDNAADRTNGARMLLAAPVWPLVVVVLLAVYIPYGIYRLARLALGKS